MTWQFFFMGQRVNGDDDVVKICAQLLREHESDFVVYHRLSNWVRDVNADGTPTAYMLSDRIAVVGSE